MRVVEEFASFKIAAGATVEPDAAVEPHAFEFKTECPKGTEHIHQAAQCDFGLCRDPGSGNLEFVLIDPDRAGELVQKVVGHLMHWQVWAPRLKGDDIGRAIVDELLPLQSELISRD